MHNFPNSLAQPLFQALQSLYKEIESDSDNPSTWTVFIASAVDVLQCLAVYDEDLASLPQQIERLHSFLNSTQRYYHDEVATRLQVERIFRCQRLRQQAETRCRELGSLWQIIAHELNIVTVTGLDDDSLAKALQSDKNSQQLRLSKIKTNLQTGSVDALVLAGIDPDKMSEWKVRQATEVLYWMVADVSRTDQYLVTMLQSLLALLKSKSRAAHSMKNETWRIPSNLITDWSPQPIASGGFGEVYRASYFGTDVAVKKLLASYPEREMVQFRSEIAIWATLNHPHILTLLGACDTIEKPFMASPFMPNGTLHKYVSHPHWTPPQGEVVRILYEVASGMAYLHNKGIVHSDLKSLNILLDAGYRAVISDFGMSHTKVTSSMAAANRVGGTCDYMAPELLDYNPCQTNFKTDVFAFGITFYETFAKGQAWTTNTGTPMDTRAVTSHILHQIRPRKRDDIPENIWCLITQYWHQEPAERPKFTDIIAQLKPLKGPVMTSVPARPSSSMDVYFDPCNQEYGHSPVPPVAIVAHNSRYPEQAYAPGPVAEIMPVVVSETPDLPRLADLEPIPGPTAETRTEPVAELTVEPPAERAVELPAEPKVESVDEPPAELNVDPKVESVDEPLVELNVELPAEPNFDHKIETKPKTVPATEPVTESLIGLATSPVTGSSAESPVQSNVQSSTESRTKLQIDSTTRPSPTENSAALARLSIGDFAALRTPCSALYSMLRSCPNSSHYLEAVNAFVAKLQPTSRQEWEGAAATYRKLAEAGVLEARFHQGWLYFIGLGVNKQESFAITYWQELYQKIPDGSSPLKRLTGLLLHWCYGIGRGVKQDWERHQSYPSSDCERSTLYVRFYRWCSLGAEMDPFCKFLKAECFRRGIGIKVELDRAFALYLELAQNDYDMAMVQVGEFYYRGQCCKKNTTTAVSWFRKATAKGNAVAQYKLAACYQEGKGVLRSQLKHAVELYGRSASQGYEPAIDALRKINGDQRAA
ncbi:uncharacterized protein BJ171DRAFT_501511 [Polychytrium aggregatum]|uniref:uncharacterized protein n=1 Tax=Polychytrium aggregatum TaxID=110093 RepID=UPI0022FE1116|nr:uncharacterized protein BJ171DRAFT_501511 [Polychytrium aggregatum]KAI9205245.1 hypothetical protein BJ171DRAFT_501511 [Polychytrium aggregatum]